MFWSLSITHPDNKVSDVHRLQPWGSGNPCVLSQSENRSRCKLERDDMIHALFMGVQADHVHLRSLGASDLDARDARAYRDGAQLRGNFAM